MTEKPSLRQLFGALRYGFSFWPPPAMSFTTMHPALDFGLSRTHDKAGLLISGPEASKPLNFTRLASAVSDAFSQCTTGCRSSVLWPGAAAMSKAPV